MITCLSLQARQLENMAYGTKAASPLIFAYTCDTKERPRIAAAINKMVKDSRLHNVRYDEFVQGSYSFADCAPNIDYVASVASNFKITELEPTITEIRKVRDLFREWFSKLY